MKAFLPKQGFTLIETVVAIGVFSIFFAAIAFIFQQILENVAVSRVRAIALSIGQEQMELIRNLPYNSVGTVGGIPNGPLKQVEEINRNNTTFSVLTSIFYIDDPFDNTAPTDAIPADYKRVRVQVSWGGLFPSRFPVTLVTNIVPKGLESQAGGGTLLIQVLNAQGQPVSNANVAITNNVVTPAINLQTITDSNGRVLIPAAPACISCYTITVTKTGYSTDKTYTTAQVANPLQPPPTVLEGSITQTSFSIDQVSRLTVTSKTSQETGYLPLTGVVFTLNGSKIIGYNTQDKPVYKYSQSFNTGGGVVGIPDLEWDNYTIDMSNSNFSLAGSNPVLPIAIAPNTTTNTLTILGDPRYTASLLLTIKNNLGELQASAATTLKNTLTQAEFTKITPGTGSANFGQVFFNNLSVGPYLLIATVSGYQEASQSVALTTNQQQTLVVNPN
jgi:prepilin-type N-terminal cleavage/methylation domain-containing protein